MKLAEQMKILCETPIPQPNTYEIDECKKKILNEATKGYFYIRYDGESVYPGTSLREFLDNEGFRISFENEFVAYIIWKERE